MPTTIALSALSSLLSQIVDPACSDPPLALEGEAYSSVAALLLPGGELIAHAAYGHSESHDGAGVEDVQEERDAANVLAGVVSEAWAREIKERGEEETPVKPKPAAQGERENAQAEGEGEADTQAAEEEEEEDTGFSFESELGRIYVSALSYDPPKSPNPNGQQSAYSSHSSAAQSSSAQSSRASKSSSSQPARYLLFGICAPESVPVSLLRAKAIAVKQYLGEALPEIGPKAAALKVPPRPAGRGTRRMISSRGGGGQAEVMA